MPYNSRADTVRLMAERYDIKSNVKLGRFQSQLQASSLSNPTEGLWYKGWWLRSPTSHDFTYILFLQY